MLIFSGTFLEHGLFYIVLHIKTSAGHRSEWNSKRHSIMGELRSGLGEYVGER